MKRGLSLLLALCMSVTLLPTAALAAGGADPITVYVTISDQGGIPVGKNNTLMAKVPVKVTDLDQNGTFSYDEAMVATHKTYYSGADDGYAINQSGWCTELWGEKNGVGGFYCNNRSLPNGVGTDTVAAGDYLTAFVYAEQTNYSDRYGYFNQTSVTAEVGESLTLNLLSVGYDRNWNLVSAPEAKATIGYLDAAGAFQTLNRTTDSDGSVTLSFDQTGTYVVSAYGDESVLVPPVCVVTVRKAGSLESGVKTAVSNCVSGYQGSKYSYGNEWMLLAQLRAVSGAEGWATKDADVKSYVESVQAAVKSGKLDRETVPTTIARVILTLTAVGMDPTRFCGQDLTAWLYEADSTEYASNDLIWALIALDSGSYTAPAAYRDHLIAALAAYQNQDGGFFYSKSWNASDVDMTAMALIALQPDQKNSTAQTMSTAAQSFLEARRNADGGYGNSCTDAYGVIARCTLNQSGTELNTLVSGMLSNYLVEQGFTYNGTRNGMATCQGLLAMDAVQRLRGGKSAVFDLTDVSKKAIRVDKPTVSGNCTYTAEKQTINCAASGFYTLSGATSATKVGSYTVTATLNDKENTTWADGSTEDVVLTWSIGKKAVSKLTYSRIADQTYTGKALKPSISVKNGSKKLTAGTDYVVSYGANKNIGTAKLTITGRGSYTGTKTITFRIVPKKVTLVSVKNAKGKKLAVKWKKNTTVTGYQIQYAANRSFKGSKTVTVSSKTSGKTLTKLTKNKWYYVHIRGYKTVSGTRYYSGWSTMKADKIRK